MTDNPSLPVLPPLGQATAGLSAESTAQAKAAYTRQGYSAEQIDAVWNAKPGTSPIVETKTGTTLFPQAGGVDGKGLTTGQRERGWAALLKGTLDPAMIKAAALKDGIVLSDPVPVEVQTQAADAKIIAGFAPPAAADGPEGYRLTLPASLKANSIDANARIMSGVRSAFWKAGVPATLANGLADALFKSSATFMIHGDASGFSPSLSPAAIDQRFKEEGARLRVLSEAGSAEVVRTAQVAIDALGEWGKAAYLRRAFHTAEAQTQLSAFGRIIEERAKRVSK